MDVTLDETHAEVLRELDRQIDLLSNGPQPSLPPFTDDISLGIHNASPNPGGQLGNPIDGLSLADKDLESELWTGDASFLVCADPGNPEVVGRDLPSADGNTNTENVSFNERHIPHIVDEESASMGKLWHYTRSFVIMQQGLLEHKRLIRTTTFKQPSFSLYKLCKRESMR